MRLNKTETIQKATDELLAILRAHPEGLRTSEMSSTPMFHGSRRLSNEQVVRLLRATYKVTESTGGQGNRTFSVWRLRATDSRIVVRG